MRLARGCPVCRQLMTAPGVGVVALTFKSTIDDPTRFAHSRDIGPYLGLVPRRYQSGETDYAGSITRTGDVMLRTALYEAATTILRMPRRSALRAWALRLAERAGMRKARVALARKLGIVLPRMWAGDSAFRWEVTGTA
jgi:transposase